MNVSYCGEQQNLLSFLRVNTPKSRETIESRQKIGFEFPDHLLRKKIGNLISGDRICAARGKLAATSNAAAKEV